MPLHTISAFAIERKGQGAMLPRQAAGTQRYRLGQGPLSVAPSHCPRESEQSQDGDCDHRHEDGATLRPSWGSGLAKYVCKSCSMAWARTRGKGWS